MVTIEQLRDLEHHEEIEEAESEIICSTQDHQEAEKEVDKKRKKINEKRKRNIK